MHRDLLSFPTRRSSDLSGKMRPFGTPLIVCPERPTRCRKVAMRCGEEIWQTRSTWPMSIPSSSDAVATMRSEEHTSELQSQSNLVCRLLLEKKNYNNKC